MSIIISPDDAPRHLFSVPELDFSEDLFAERADGPWLRLGAWTVTRRRDARNVEEEVFRQSLMLAPESFANIFDRLESVGNVIGHLGHAGVIVYGDRGYEYLPFHHFEFSSTSVAAEPLVFRHEDTSSGRLFINPDLWMFLKLEEKSPEGGIWWDPRRGVDALFHRVLDDGTLEVVDVRTDYLLKYLQARQRSLLVGHYRQLLLFDSPPASVEAFVKEDVTLGSPEQGTKAMLQNWGLRRGFREPYLQRRLHLWFQIAPPELDGDDPWTDRPSFDPYTFTLPTGEGPVAPYRWRSRGTEGEDFAGGVCDFMDRVYFRQEVLGKYEGASGFEVRDDGSVSCYHWGLTRSTSRLGNDLVCTAIGDFAEGVPLEEWPHWRQYAVEPPSSESVRVIVQEERIPDAVNAVVEALSGLSAIFAELAELLGVQIKKPLWDGSVESLACRQMKWTYPAAADDDEFLKRATLTSTLVLDSLMSPPLIQLLRSISGHLHENYENPPKPLGSRKLLQRLTLIAILIEDFRPDRAVIPDLVSHAEGESRSDDDELQVDLERISKGVRKVFEPLAFLYDLRTHGGLAHPPNREGASKAAAQLGLPERNWHRTDYLRLLRLIEKAVHNISMHLANVRDAIADDGLSERGEETP
jgi:hypothetical protein